MSSGSPSFKLKSECSSLEDTNTVPLSVTAIPVGPGIFEIVLVFKNEYLFLILVNRESKVLERAKESKMKRVLSIKVDTSTLGAR